MDSLWTSRSITSFNGLCYESIDSSVSQNIFLYLKMFTMQCRKNITDEDNKKIMNIANFINIYTSTYIPISYVTRMTQNKKDSINSILQHGLFVDKTCWVVLPTSGFPYLTLCPRQCKWKISTTYLAIRTKNNYENLLLLKSPQITRSNIEDWY